MTHTSSLQTRCRIHGSLFTHSRQLRTWRTNRTCNYRCTGEVLTPRKFSIMQFIPYLQDALSHKCNYTFHFVYKTYKKSQNSHICSTKIQNFGNYGPVILPTCHLISPIPHILFFNLKLFLGFPIELSVL